MKDGIKDMHLVAAICAYGGEISGVNTSNPKEQYFSFTQEQVPFVWILRGDQVEKFSSCSIEDIEEFHRFGLLMYPPSFTQQLRKIKNIIYSYGNKRKWASGPKELSVGAKINQG